MTFPDKSILAAPADAAAAHVPMGIQIAKKTFNPRLGIEGGISILGTTGIVEPMSEQALIDTISVELDVRRAQNEEFIIVTPGNYGQDFLRDNLGIDIPPSIPSLGLNVFFAICIPIGTLITALSPPSYE